MPVLPEDNPTPPPPLAPLGSGPCSVWATTDDLCDPCSEESIVVSDANFVLASNLLWAWSGRQYSGICEQTIRPCARRNGRRGMDDAVPGGWNRSWGTCRCDTSPCGCSGHSSIELGAYPIQDIVEVVIDGQALDTFEYRVDDWRYLVRLADADGARHGWPAWQDLARDDGEDGTWSVTFQWGREIPPEGVRAAAVLACELALQCNPALSTKCRLPKTVTTVSRENVTMVMSPSDFLDKNGKTGIWEIDLFLRAANPERHDRNAAVWTPGMSQSRRRTDSGAGS